jgi:hypothetical protein
MHPGQAAHKLGRRGAGRPGRAATGAVDGVLHAVLAMTASGVDQLSHLECLFSGVASAPAATRGSFAAAIDDFGSMDARSSTGFVFTTAKRS